MLPNVNEKYSQENIPKKSHSIHDHEQEKLSLPGNQPNQSNHLISTMLMKDRVVTCMLVGHYWAPPPPPPLYQPLQDQSSEKCQPLERVKVVSEYIVTQIVELKMP